MDSFELSKIAGAVLSALLLIFGSNVLIESRLASSPSSKDVGYILPNDTASQKSAEAGSGEPSKQANAAGSSSEDTKDEGAFDPKVVLALLATAKPEDGEAVFKKCAACHGVKKDAPSAAAPNLWGIVTRPKGSQADFATKYSEALKTKGGNWSYEELALFVHKPKGYIAGTKMAFAGLNDPKEIANVLSYLRTLSDQPVPLPK